MLTKAQILLFACVLLSTTSVLADRGASKKSKSKSAFTLNIKTPVSLRNSISFNLKSGLNYKGSTLGSNTATNSGMRISTSTVSYQKGNTVYILPYKHKIAVPELRQGYAGMKLIIRSQ